MRIAEFGGRDDWITTEKTELKNPATMRGYEGASRYLYGVDIWQATWHAPCRLAIDNFVFETIASVIVLFPRIAFRSGNPQNVRSGTTRLPATSPQ
jgi:hypothetical protein